MSNTRHHNAPKAPRMLRLDDTYTGWKGENCWAQDGRKFIKRQEHRANRQGGKRQLAKELVDI